MFGAFGQQLVIGIDRRQGPAIRREPGNNGGGVHQSALSETDNPLHFQFAVSTGMTVGTGPTPERGRGVSAGFDRDDVGADRAHYQRRGDPCIDVSGVHGPVQQQDIDHLVPRRMAWFGLIGGPLLLVGQLGVLFDLWEAGSAASVLVVPEAIWELFVGFYCAFRGFRRDSPILSHEP